MALSKGNTILVLTLLVSLGLNFFFAGLIVGNRTSGEGGVRMEQEINTHSAGTIAADRSLREQLSEEDRQILKQAMQDRREQFRSLRQEFQIARAEVEQAMAREPFDKGVLDVAMAREHAVQTKKEELKASFRKKVADQLSPEGRKVFDEMTAHRYGGDRNSGKWSKPDRREGFRNRHSPRQSQGGPRH